MTKLSMSEEEMLKRKYTRPYEKRIEKLEKENNKLLDVINNQDVKIADLESNFRICEKNADTYYDQRSKAKEIIKDQKELLDRVLSGAETLSDFAQDTLRKAEQFLKGENIILEDAQAGNSPFDADEVFHKEMKAYPEEK